MFEYPVNIEKGGEGEFIVSFPDVPEANTYGMSLDSALAFAQDSLKVALSFYIDDKLSLPIPSRPSKGQHTVKLSPMANVKLFIYQELLEQGTPIKKFAKLLNCDAKQVRRILDLDHNSTFDQLTTALGLLGYDLQFKARSVGAKKAPVHCSA